VLSGIATEVGETKRRALRVLKSQSLNGNHSCEFSTKILLTKGSRCDELLTGPGCKFCLNLTP
jgi:hypothetical protein